MKSLAALPLLMVFCLTAEAYPDGAPPGHTGGFGEADCSVCHAGGMADEAEVVFELPESMAAGQTVGFILSVSHPDMKSLGLQLTAGKKSDKPLRPLAINLEGIKLRSREDRGFIYLSHQQPIPADDGQVQIKGTWQTPPKSGEVVINLALVASNDDLSPLGDAVITLSRHTEIR